MPKRAKSTDAYSRVSTKSQTVLPKAVRETLAIRPGDSVRYRITDAGVIIDKAPAADADDPFATFSEWSSPNDSAYDNL